MAHAAKRDALREARSGNFILKSVDEKSPLDDPEEQDRIINPPIIEATIGGDPVLLHALNARHTRGFTGLIEGSLVDLFAGTKDADNTTWLYRLGGIIAEKYGDRILPFIARATFPPGEFKESALAEAVADIDGVITYSEQKLILTHMLTQNHILDSLSRSAGAAKKA